MASLSSSASAGAASVGVLRFQLPQSFGFGDLHAAVLGLPAVPGALGNAVLTGQVNQGPARLMLLEDRDDLLF